jgi:hypothetical protein
MLRTKPLVLAGIARVTRERFGESVDESMRALHAAAVAFQVAHLS